MIKEEIRVNSTQLKNRLVMPPMATETSNDGYVTDELLAYYEDHLKSGKLGLLITEHAYVREDGKASPGQVSVADDSRIEGLKRLSALSHSYQTPIVLQINHAGMRAGFTFKGEEDEEAIIASFVKAALRAKAAGFDGVEIHSAHGYLLNQVYSPLTHKEVGLREDNFEDRIRIQREIIKRIRKEASKDFIISLRLGAIDDQEGGSTVVESLSAAKIYEAEGLDMISITGGLSGYIRKTVTYPGRFKEASLPIKKEVKIPVLLTGGIRTKEDCEALLKEGACDLVGIGRALLKDPDLPEKLIN